MGKLLLTSGQVSVLLSTTIIFVCTFALFIAGYILQQQTVTALRLTLKPQEPKNPHELPQVPLAQTLQSSPKLGGSLGSAGHAAFQSYLSPAGSSFKPADWSRLAHVQLVRDHHQVCSAIMLFAALHQSRSPARRILLFPQAWAADLAPKKGDISDPFTMSTRRLLKLAARRYRVEIRPITTLLEGADEDKTSSYSLAAVYSLADLDRALVLQAPGLILEAEALDQVLAYSTSTELAVIDENKDLGLSGEEILLIRPARDAFAALRASEMANATADMTADIRFFNHILPSPLVLNLETDKESHHQLVRSISALRHVEHGFDPKEWLRTTSYLRFSDDKLPRGPEFDSPWDDKRAARPKNRDADWIWTDLYGRFAQERVEVCGLDLDIWRGS